MASACSERLRLIGWPDAAGLKTGRQGKEKGLGRRKLQLPLNHRGEAKASLEPLTKALEAGSRLHIPAPTMVPIILPTGHARRAQICGLKPGEGNWAREKEGTQPHRPSISGYLGPQVETVTKDELQFQLPHENSSQLLLPRSHVGRMAKRFASNAFNSVESRRPKRFFKTLLSL